MFKKCKANCQANDNLYLRNNVFYYMKELPRQNGKRRYFIKSLYTKNYYEALEKVKQMQMMMIPTQKTVNIDSLILTAERLAQTMILNERIEKIDLGGKNYSTQSKIYITTKRSPKNTRID